MHSTGLDASLLQALEDLYTHYDGTVRNAAGGIVQVRCNGMLELDASE